MTHIHAGSPLDILELLEGKAQILHISLCAQHNTLCVAQSQEMFQAQKHFRPSALASHSVKTRRSLIPASWARPVSCAPATPIDPPLSPQLVAYNEGAKEGLCRERELDLKPEFARYQLCGLGQSAFSL